MTIIDVAAEAGVSISTVSRVLNHPELVNIKTRKKVEAILSKHNFVPSTMAHELISTSRKNIAIFSNNIRHPHFAATAYVLDEMFFSLGYNCVICNTGDDAEKRRKQYRTLADLRIDGIALLGSTFMNIGTEDAISHYFPNVPVVISNGILSLPNSHSVLIDQRYGMEMAISHLIDRGHRQIGFVHSERSFNANRKIKAFQEIMETKNLPLYDSNIFYTPPGVPGGGPLVEQYLAQQCTCTALIFADDLPAVAAISQFRYHGVQVPKDVAIVGYDNSAYCLCSYPQLTSVDTKSGILATVLGNTLHDLMNHRDVGSTISIRPELVVRDST